MNKHRKVMLLIDAVIIIVGIILDQITKYLATDKLKGQSAFVLIEGVFELDYLENTGSAFGMFQGQRWMLLVVGFVFMAVILFLMVRLPEGKKFDVAHILLALVVAGGVGNMIDRFALGYVVDFFSFVLINYPIFNVADIYVVCATIGLFIMFLFVFKEQDLEFLSLKCKNQEK